MSKDIKIPKWQGNLIELTNQKNRRLIDGGKLCYGCNKVKDLDLYYEKGTRCKDCQRKLSKERWEKQKQPLW